MKVPRRDVLMIRSLFVLGGALLPALARAAVAQVTPASSSSTAPAVTAIMPGMDHAGMHDMAIPATAAGSTPKPATPAPGGTTRKPHPSTRPSSSLSGAHDMGGMHHHAMPDEARGSTHGMSHAPSPAAPAATGHGMSGMGHGAGHDMDSTPVTIMASMQGGRAPAEARSGDYSDGSVASAAHALHLHGSAPVGMLLIDQLEAFRDRDGSGQSWDAASWYGNDSDKLWLRSEGERRQGKLEDGNLEAFWNHNVATFWSTQLGVRHDFGTGPRRDWTAFGIQGVSPYWFEIAATAYVGPAGRTAVRLRADYELLFTQRLILQPELEVNLHGKSDPARGIGSGLTDAKLGLRLRYEIRRECAPYIGVIWVRRFGATADLSRADHQATFDRQWVAGLRLWF